MAGSNTKPPGVASDARLGTVTEGRPAGLGNGEGNPDGLITGDASCAGLGEARPDGLGVPKLPTPGVVAGAAGCGTARSDRLPVWAWPDKAARTRAARQPSRSAAREAERVFTAVLPNMERVAAALLPPSCGHYGVCLRVKGGSGCRTGATARAAEVEGGRVDGPAAWPRAGSAEPLSAREANRATLQDSKLMRRLRRFTCIGYFSAKWRDRALHPMQPHAASLFAWRCHRNIPRAGVTHNPCKHFKQQRGFTWASA